MKSRRVRKQSRRRQRNSRRRLRGGGKIVYTTYFYEADGSMEPLGQFNPYPIELEEGSQQTLAQTGVNPGEYADTIDEETGEVIRLNLNIPILSQSHLIKNNKINIHKSM
jgi:hypothetical protein